MKTASIVLLALANLGCFAFALKLLLARGYFPYHSQVTGKTWEELAPGERVVIQALMRGYGSGNLGAALAGGWATWLLATGAEIPVLLTVLPGMIIGVVTLFLVTSLIRNGGTGAPRTQVAVLVAFGFAGLVLWPFAA